MLRVAVKQLQSAIKILCQNFLIYRILLALNKLVESANLQNTNVIRAAVL